MARRLREDLATRGRPAADTAGKRHPFARRRNLKTGCGQSRPASWLSPAGAGKVLFSPRRIGMMHENRRVKKVNGTATSKGQPQMSTKIKSGVLTRRGLLKRGAAAA